MQLDSYTTTIPSGSHWSLLVRKGMQMKITDLNGGANVGMIFFNPTFLFERLNVPDSMKCQHTYHFSAGHCLYSDMGRIFASIIEDSLSGHEAACGNSHADFVTKKWGGRDYQTEHNQWKQNGYDAFLTELSKYELSRRDLPANLNFFSKTVVDDSENLTLVDSYSPAGSAVTLRFEMDTLVILHTCPHPLSESEVYPEKPVEITLSKASPLTEDDICLNYCNENRRGFENNALYHLGA